MAWATSLSFFRGLFLFRDWCQLFKHGIDAFAGIIGRPSGNGLRESDKTVPSSMALGRAGPV